MFEVSIVVVIIIVVVIVVVIIVVVFVVFRKLVLIKYLMSVWILRSLNY